MDELPKYMEGNMNTNELLELIEVLKNTGYKHIDVSHEGSHVLLSNTAQIEKTIIAEANRSRESMTELAPVQNEAPIVEKSKVSKSVEAKKAEGHIIESPIVGTFYHAATPDAKPFVQIGSKVKKGDVLCIIEAMKLMNEIEADIDGEIVEIFVENENAVEYGQPLFRIK